jgi:hypothetical protein
MSRRVRIGARATPIRLGNPSRRVASGLSPVSMNELHAKQVWFDGALEREILPQLTVDPRTVAIEQGLAPIQWSDGKRWRIYRPRFSVRRKDGNVVLIEVAWAAVAEAGDLRRELGLVDPFVRNVGFSGIELYTDVQIRDPVRRYNAYLLRRAANQPPDMGVLEKATVRAHAAGGAVAGRQLVDGLAEGPKALLALARLIFDGRLRLADPKARLGVDERFEVPV